MDFCDCQRIKAILLFLMLQVRDLLNKVRDLAGLATPSKPGLMSDADKRVVDDLAAGKGVVRIVSKRITHDDLTANADNQRIALNTGLPIGAWVLGATIRVHTPFSGGGIVACTGDVGDDAQTTREILQGCNLASLGDKSSPGVNGSGRYSGVALSCIIRTDGGNVVALNAGDVTVEVAYTVLPL